MENSAMSDIFKQKKVCVLIPTYNNAKTIGEVLESIVQYTDQIIVVNDGSTDKTSEILKKYPSLTQVTSTSNKGKGFALRTGFSKALELGYNYVISIDSDGQHFASDLPGFMEALAHNPSALIIGVRNMDQESIPGKSSFGNKFSNFWFWVETGLTLHDTQSGYRLYPLQGMKSMRFFTTKFEFEIEVLVRSAWKGIAITEVPIQVFYAEKENRVSHFRPFRDFTRISILNTVLVTITLLYIKPRDFIRSIKKKTSGKPYGIRSSTPLRAFLLKRLR